MCSSDLFIPQSLKPWLVKGLREDIGKLILGGHIREINIALLNMIPNEVMTNLNMLRLGMKNRVVGDLDFTFIIT